MDQAIGENLDLRSRVGVLRRAIAGLLIILSSWRGVEWHRRRTAEADQAAAEVEPVLRRALAAGGSDAERLRAAARGIEQVPAVSASHRLLLERIAHALNGLAAAAVGLRLLRQPLGAALERGLPATRVRNPLGAALNGVRSFVTVLLAAAIWVATGWDAGATFLIFVMVVVVLFGTRDDTAFSGATAMAASCAIALALGAALRFAVMPLAQGMGLDGFASLCVILGVPLALMGTLAMLLPTGRPLSGLAFMSLANLMPLLAPTNEITYDFANFLNGGLAILAGATLGAASHRWLPPLPRSWRAALLLRGARRDLARIASGAWRPEREVWEARQYARLAGLPPGPTALAHAQLLAALSVGRELLRRDVEMAAQDDFRVRASRFVIAEAMASQPDFFRGLGLLGAAVR